MNTKIYIYSLTFLFLLQSCVVYQKTPVHLNEASDMGKVKVITAVGETLKFKNIEQKDGMYYGVNKKRGETTDGNNEIIEVILPLFPDNIEFIYLKSKSGSITASVLGIAAVGLGAFFIAFILIYAGVGFGV